MKIPKFFLFVFLSVLYFPHSVTAQGGGLDAEIGFQYVKAEYLFETNRFEECIQEYNLVIAKNPAYKDALVKRATAKFNLGAYKGAKMDAIQSIDLTGITAQAAFILARAETSLGNLDAAINSISASVALESKVEYLEARANLYEKTQQLLKACQDYNDAARLGSAIGEQKSRDLCGGYKPKSTPPIMKPKQQQAEPQSEPTENNNEPTPADSGEDTQANEQNSETEVPADDPTIPKEDDFVQFVEIDDELGIDIYGQGLGRRKITVTPSILIIADESGTVTLDICVNNRGEVTKAEFNATKSTIAKKSMVNLALRKAKEFAFEKSVYTNQCGYMVFKVKAN